MFRRFAAFMTRPLFARPEVAIAQTESAVRLARTERALAKYAAENATRGEVAHYTSAIEGTYGR